ncbi:MAG TPA: LptA/OstA family protein [Patescibacteria group bacterium]|nr:LptA/OstA family protein [Patescibacteria group bacterium]
MRSEKPELRNEKARTLILVFLFLASQFSPPAFAQKASAPKPGKDQPLEITADQTLEWHRNDLKYIARGNVVARQGNAIIQADVLTADYRQSKKSQNDIYRLTATGHVTITSEKNTATGDEAIYDVDTSTATMTGKNLTLTSPEQVVTARDKFVYETVNGKLIAYGDAKAVRKTDKGTDVITANSLSAWFKQDNTGKRALDKLAANGNVIITTPTDILHGDNGEYIATTRLASVTGHVRIERGRNILEGDRAEIDLNTNVSRMVGAPGAHGRVRAVFYPGDKDFSSLKESASPMASTQPATGGTR